MQEPRRHQGARRSQDGHETFEMIGPGHDYESVTQKISSLVLRPGLTMGWLQGVGIFGLMTLMLLTAVTATLLWGVGLWGNNQPVGWAFDIINFVWWIGIGHAGTLISAILLLLHQNWRTSINRYAEAMTIFAVAQAGMFSLLHIGRPQYAYWMLAFPNSMAPWAPVRSPPWWGGFGNSTH